MRKVDLVYSSWVNAPNGASSFVRKLVQEKEKFAQSGIELNLYSADLVNPKSFKNTKSLKNKAILKNKLLKLSKYSIFLTFFLLHKFLLKHAKTIVDYYDKNGKNADIVAFQELFTCYYYLRLHPKHKNKIYLTLHTNGSMWKMLSYMFPKIVSRVYSSYRTKIEKTILGGCDMIGFVSEDSRRVFLESYPEFDSRKTFVIYNGIDYRDYNEHQLSSIIKFISVATLSDRKNQMGILQSLSLLSLDIQKQISITFVGGGTIQKELEKKAKHLKTEVNFIGSSNEVEKWLAMANCFVLFSKDEGLPIAIIEAMRSGLPIIASNIAGIPEMVEVGKSGYLVELDNEKLASCISSFVSNKEDIKKMGKRSYEIFCEKFTINNMIDKYIAIYNK